MTASRFTTSIADFPAQGMHLLYNALTRAQVVIDDELRSALAALPEPPAHPRITAALDQLGRMGFVVAAENDDTRALEAWFAASREDDTVLRPTILATYSCNFGCTYCVEEGVKGPVSMDRETAAKSVRFIQKKTEEYGSTRIALHFSGGEPLLNMPAIRVVAGELNEYGRAYGIPFAFGLSTNGALFDGKTAENLTPLGLTWARVSLDGPPAAHDVKRPFQDGRGTFGLLMRQIEETVTLTKLDIAINFDRENGGEIPILLDYLASRGLAAKIRTLVINPITPSPERRETLAPGSEMACDAMSLRTARQKLTLQRLALERGFNVDISIAPRQCSMVKRSSFIIDPRGDLYRCAGLAGRREFRAGSINGKECDLFLGTELWKRCAQCPWVPICGDGCPFAAYLRCGDPFALFCSRRSVEYAVKESLKLSYRRSREKIRT
ncbi:MAG TPA: radical SAM protein [Spirochaetia bacterium]|nr:radical SAM protein [Spirochaetia bacterium]